MLFTYSKINKLIRSSATAEKPRDALLVNSCYVSRGTGVEKVSNSKTGIQVIQGHWQWRHSTGHIRCPIRLPIATMPLSCTVSEILSHISQNLKRSRDSEHIPFGSNISVGLLLCIYQHTEFEVPSFTNSKNMMGQNLKKGSRDSDHAHLRIVCHPKDSTGYILYQYTKFNNDSHLSRSGVMIAGIENINGSCDSDHTPFRGICHP